MTLKSALSVCGCCITSGGGVPMSGCGRGRTLLVDIRLVEEDILLTPIGLNPAARGAGTALGFMMDFLMT
jgi:hypothetical protein